MKKSPTLRVSCETNSLRLQTEVTINDIRSSIRKELRNNLPSSFGLINEVVPPTNKIE